MRKSKIGALVASAFVLCGTAHAGLKFDLNGILNPGGDIVADALDWAPTSFLALGGNSAIASFLADPKCPTASCTFDVLTHAKLIAYKPVGGSSFISLPAFGGEITMVARFTERVTAALPGADPSATFRSTGAGWTEFYYSAAGSNSNEVTGFGFNDGTLIGKLDGIKAGVLGSFTIDGGVAPSALDQAPPADLYTGQSTVTGTGSQGNLIAGTAGVVLDPGYFLTNPADFKFNYANVSIGLPFTVVHPSDCFNDVMRGAGVVIGTGSATGLTSTCDNAHTNTTYAGQAASTGYLPVVGAINGLGLGSPDFVASTDFNSSVAGTVPEPGSLALLGLALAAAGFVSVQRRKS